MTKTGHRVETGKVERRNEENVLITGASGGIGSSLALAFAERGYGVAMQYHSREQAARETAERICSGGGTAEIFSADISREDEVSPV